MRGWIPTGLHRLSSWQSLRGSFLTKFWEVRRAEMTAVTSSRSVQWAPLLYVTWRASATYGGLDETAGKRSRKRGARRGKPPPPHPRYRQGGGGNFRRPLDRFILYAVRRGVAIKDKARKEDNELNYLNLGSIFREDIARVGLKTLTQSTQYDFRRHLLIPCPFDVPM